MKKLLAVSAIAALGLTSTIAFADDLPEEMSAAPVAVYLGIEGGLGLTNWKQSFSTNNDSGFVGRAFLGYDLNKYFAAEFGYSYFFNQTKITRIAVNDYKINTQSFDLVGKGKLPILDKFSLFAKFGIGCLLSNVRAQTSPETMSGFANNRTAFNVVYGIGADYNFTPNIIANIEWLRVNGKLKWVNNSDLSKLQRYTDAFMIGLRYKFDL
ncbi:Outer membrane protein [Gammaproteobacteria bacterium]